MNVCVCTWLERQCTYALPFFSFGQHLVFCIVLVLVNAKTLLEMSVFDDLMIWWFVCAFISCCSFAYCLWISLVKFFVSFFQWVQILYVLLISSLFGQKMDTTYLFDSFSIDSWFVFGFGSNCCVVIISYHFFCFLPELTENPSTPPILHTHSFKTTTLSHPTKHIQTTHFHIPYTDVHHF